MVAKTPKAKPAPKKNKPNPNLAPKEADSALKKTKDGKIQKKSNTTQKRPLGKDTRDTIKAARMALAEGKVASDEQQRKHAMDLRTLYVRFKKSHPEGESEVREKLGNHPEIKFVRIPRQNQKNRNVRWAFVEFGSEAQCEAAKETLTKGAEAKDELYVDFVGVKSKSGGKPTQERGKRGKTPINPNRLFIGGLVEGLTEVKLKQLFPKCVEVVVKGAKAGKGFAFIQFDNPGDAKAAFDASKKLTITGKSGSEGHHMTVVYARMNKSSGNKLQEQKSKRQKIPELAAKSKDEAAEKVKEDATDEDVKTDAATDNSQTKAVDKETEDDSEGEKEGEGNEAAKKDSESEVEENGENDAGSESDEVKDNDSESGEEADGDEEMENDAESSEDES